MRVSWLSRSSGCGRLVVNKSTRFINGKPELTHADARKLRTRVARRRPSRWRAHMFVVCGEALLDVFTWARPATGLSLDANVGGSPFNLAIGLARLGQPVAFLGAVSDRLCRRRLMRALQRRRRGHVCRAHAERADHAEPRRARRARRALVLVLRRRLRRPAVATRPTLRQRAAEARALCLGSYARVVEPVASALRALVEREQGRTLIAFDPNIRLNVEPDIARWRAQLEWMLPRIDLLKISDEDLAAPVPRSRSRRLRPRTRSSGVPGSSSSRAARWARSAWTAHGTCIGPAGGGGRSSTRSAPATPSRPRCSPGWPNATR